MFYVYILYSEIYDKFYIGQTNNIQDRLRRHNEGLENYTSKYKPWNLIGFVKKETRTEAVQLEKKLKNLNRERLKIFIDNHCES